MKPEFLEKIEERNEALGNFELPDTEEGRLLAKYLYSHFSDQSDLLSHIYKLREALEKVDSSGGPECSLCHSDGPPCHDWCLSVVAQQALLHDPTKGGE